jgi:O-antigen/teichoic acid export membrane protein
LIARGRAQISERPASPIVDSVVRLLTLPISGCAALFAAHLVITSGGDSIYAAITLVWGILALLPFADLGLGANVATTVAESRDSINDRRVDIAIVSAMRVLIVVGLAIVALAVIASRFGAWESLLPSAAALDANLGVPFLLCLFAVNLPLGLWQRVAIGAGKNRVTIYVGLVNSLFPLAAALLYSAHWIPGVLLAGAPAAGSLTASVFGIAVLQHSRVVNFKRIFSILFAVRAHPGVPVLVLGLPMMVILIASPLAIQSDRFILSWVAGTDAVASYGLAAQLYAPALGVLSTGTAGLWAHFASLRAQSQELTRPYLSALMRVAPLGIFLGAAMALLGPFVAEVAGGGLVVVDRLMFAGFGALLIIQACALPGSMFLTSSVGLRFQALCISIMLLVNVPLSFLLVSMVGPSGPIWASTISVAGLQFAPSIVRILGRARADGVA